MGSEGDDADGEPRVVGGLCVRGFYSDLLYQPWHCATAELQPEWLEVSNVDRCGDTGFETCVCRCKRVFDMCVV